MGNTESSGADEEVKHPALMTAPGDLPDDEAAFAAVKNGERPDPLPRDTTHREVDIDLDITGQSTCTGEFTDFAGYFRDRHQKLSSLLENRRFDAPKRNIGSLGRGRNQGGEDTVIIGMVFDKWTSRNNHQMLKIDDSTGSLKVIVTDEDLKERCTRIVTDEVIAVEGQLTDDADAIFANQIYFPDVPARNQNNTADREVKAVLASDFHLGSKDFASERWNAFVDWMHEQDDIEYLISAGDLVEGIGVYPGQKEELVVPDIERQYELAAEALKELPDDLDIISTVGNHDSIRLAEPQPSLPEKFTQYFDENVQIVGNPAMVTIEGVKFLVYHGMSLDGLIAALPDANYEDPTSAMEYYLQKRHLAPTWGEKVRLAPEDDDWLAIMDIPDVLHCGHTHTFGMRDYNSVKLINSGTWQEQTDFQKSKNISPDVGYAPVVNLQTLDVNVRKF